MNGRNDNALIECLSGMGIYMHSSVGIKTHFSHKLIGFTLIYIHIQTMKLSLAKAIVFSYTLCYTNLTI